MMLRLNILPFKINKKEYSLLIIYLSLLFILFSTNYIISKENNNVLCCNNIDELIKKYEGNDSLVINYLISYNTPDSISRNEFLWFDNTYIEVVGSFMSNQSVSYIPFEISSLKNKSIYFLLQILDSSFVNSESEYITFKINAIDIIYDYSAQVSEIIENDESTVYIKNDNYYIIDERLKSWYKIFKNLGLEKIRELKIYPFKTEEINYLKAKFKF